MDSDYQGTQAVGCARWLLGAAGHRAAAGVFLAEMREPVVPFRTGPQRAHELRRDRGHSV
jgi:hypothetical protein